MVRFEFLKNALRISSVKVDDAGLYVCCAENIHGRTCSNFSLEVQIGQFCLAVYLDTVRQKWQHYRRAWCCLYIREILSDLTNSFSGTLSIGNVMSNLCVIFHGTWIHRPSMESHFQLSDETVLPAIRHKWTHPALTPPRGRYSIYLPRRDGRLSWARWLGTYRDGLSDYRHSEIQVAGLLRVSWSKPKHRNYYT